MSRVFLGFNNSAKASERTGIATTLTHISGHFFPHRVGHPASLPGHGFFERRLVEPGSERVTPDRVLLAVAAGFLGFVAAQHREHVQALEFASDSVPRFRYSPAGRWLGSWGSRRGREGCPGAAGDAVAGATKGQPHPVRRGLGQRPPHRAGLARAALQTASVLPGHGQTGCRRGSPVQRPSAPGSRGRPRSAVGRSSSSLSWCSTASMWPTRPPTADASSCRMVVHCRRCGWPPRRLPCAPRPFGGGAARSGRPSSRRPSTRRPRLS